VPALEEVLATAILLRDAGTSATSGDLLGLGDGDHLAAREEAEPFASAIPLAQGKGDLALGVAVPEREAAE